MQRPYLLIMAWAIAHLPLGILIEMHSEVRSAMLYNPEKHHRRSIRLRGFDYTCAGAYFITLCTYQRQCLFGEIVDGQMVLNPIGLFVQACWQRSPNHFQNLTLDEFVMMPNHLHGILVLTDKPGRGVAFGQDISVKREDFLPNATPLQLRGTQSGSVGAIIQNFKSVTTRRINQWQKSPGNPVWQRNYYEHIIRNETAWKRIQQYIQTNPQTWQQDQLYPNNPPKW